MGWFPDMFWLAGEILLLLLLALVVGVLLGWLLWGRRRTAPEVRETVDAAPVRTDVVTAEAHDAAGRDDFERTMTSLAASRDTDYQDDLKRISGVGPMLEGMLRENGLHNFLQVASLDAAAIKALDARLDAFPGRITRDDWVGQAKALHKETHDEDL